MGKSGRENMDEKKKEVKRGRGRDVRECNQRKRERETKAKTHEMVWWPPMKISA